ncbi:hypothetical protein LBC_05140 [Campylobacter sp. 19-13652]|nr:hypothetical protein LBC_05140 [Campylobacter sp. 19-13652]
MFGNVFYRGYDFSADDNILVLYSKDNIGRYENLFLTCSISSSIRDKYSYAKQYRQKSFNSTNIIIPSKNNEPDFNFMRDFISAT